MAGKSAGFSDPAKRAKTLEERGLNFEEAAVVFAGPTFEFEDVRRDYGERRMVCYGVLASRLVAVGYVERGDARHIFYEESQWKRNRTICLIGQ
jgi:hypothetical protein